MTDRYESITDRLGAIEEELRDIAYERLAEAARAPGSEDSDNAEAEEKRVLQARRAIAKAINTLSR
jgi:hypothetical protein